MPFYFNQLFRIGVMQRTSVIFKKPYEIEIIKMEITSQSNTQVLVYVEINYRYTAGYTTTGHTTYKLVKDSSNSSWLFDPN